ncbi:hypothetical protein ABT317_49890, partial [Streptomyces carpinensis]
PRPPSSPPRPPSSVFLIARAVEDGLDRQAALAATARRYCELMRLGDPVHTWPVGLPEPVPLG